MRNCGLIPAPLRPAPSDNVPAVSELLPGEQFAVVDISGPWAWGYCRADHYVGYVETIALVESRQSTHVVVEATAPIEATPDPLSPILAALPMGSRLCGEEKGALLAIEGGFVPLAHLRPIDEHEDDPATVAQRLLGAAHAEGGRTMAGVDCSGLVQLALSLCGIPAPRDVDQQRSLGERLAEDRPLRRGDLVFRERHVGLMADDRMVIHISPISEKVAVEPLCATKAERSHWECRRLQR